MSKLTDKLETVIFWWVGALIVFMLAIVTIALPIALWDLIS